MQPVLLNTQKGQAQRHADSKPAPGAGMHTTVMEDNRPQTAIQKKQVLQMVRTKSTPKKKPEEEQGTRFFYHRQSGQLTDADEDIDMEKIENFLQEYTDPETVSFKYRKKGQRVDVDSSQNTILSEMMKEKDPKKTYIDPSYHETVQYIDKEYGEFYDKARKAGLNGPETHKAYDMLMSNQQSKLVKSTIESSEHAPLTTMTPSLMELYHGSHYQKELKKKDETSSARAYESDFIGESAKRMDFSLWRAFSLPEQKSSDEKTFVNTLGGTMDSNLPTAGHTIGQGKVYSAIYKHFQKTMEIINIIIDNEHGEYKSGTEDAFIDRTKLQIPYIQEQFMLGMYANEQDNFSTDTGFDTWMELAQAINDIVLLISGSAKNVSAFYDTGFAIQIDLKEMLKDKRTFVKKFEIIGTVIGMFIKREKRLFMNFNMLKKEDEAVNCLQNLSILNQVEEKINIQVDELWGEITTELGKKGEHKQISKELQNLGPGPPKRKMKSGNDNFKRFKSEGSFEEEYKQLDDNDLFDDIGPQLTLSGGVPLTGYQVGALLKMFKDPVNQVVTYNGVELRIVRMSGSLPKTDYNPNGLALGLMRRLRGG